MPKYKALFSRYKGQPSGEIFATFKWSSAIGETWESPFKRLSDIAKDENWNFQDMKFKKENANFPILTSYLNSTFLRIQELNLLAHSGDGDRVCFNTGLQNRNQKNIYATFYKNRQAESRDFPDWTLYTFADSYSQKLNDFKPLPDLATYINDPSDLVINSDYEFDINIDHIIDSNSERLPEVLRENRTLAVSAIKGAMAYLREKLKRNYKIAIPHWYEGKIQHLLPLNLLDDSTPDLALVADKDNQTKKYRITTGLTMDMAYIDARLITRPDKEWLNP